MNPQPFPYDKLILSSYAELHIGEHDVTGDDVDQACFGRPAIYATDMERLHERERIKVVGPTETDRILAVILERVNSRTFLVITAHWASSQERRDYLNDRRRSNE